MGQEWLYRDEFEGYEAEGVLQMHTAFSREQATFDGATVGDPYWEVRSLISP